MLRDALNLELVTLPEEAGAWPAPLSLAVGLNEVVLIEGVASGVGELLLEVAALLHSPATGRVRHWGQSAEGLPREDLYDLRRRIAYVTPRQVLLHRLTLGENIALGPCYHQGYTGAEALHEHQGLLELLELEAHLSRYPPQVSPLIYARAVWARELCKEPELILAVIAGPRRTLVAADRLAAMLRDYLALTSAAVLLLGESLEPFYPLGHRLLRLEAGQLREQPLLRYQPRPLSSYLPLV